SVRHLVACLSAPAAPTTVPLPRPTPPPSLLLMIPRPPTSTLFPYTTLFRSVRRHALGHPAVRGGNGGFAEHAHDEFGEVAGGDRSEEHTSELQSRFDLVCRLLLEKKTTRHRCVRRARPGAS